MTTQRTPEEFAVGEVALYWRPGSPSHLREVTIVGPLKEEYVHDVRDGSLKYEMVYAIEGIPGTPPSGKAWCAPPEYLRKKKPPREDLQVVRWSECPWQPQQVRA